MTTTMKAEEVTQAMAMDSKPGPAHRVVPLRPDPSGKAAVYQWQHDQWVWLDDVDYPAEDAWSTIRDRFGAGKYQIRTGPGEGDFDERHLGEPIGRPKPSSGDLAKAFREAVDPLLGGFERLRADMGRAIQAVQTQSAPPVAQLSPPAPTMDPIMGHILQLLVARALAPPDIGHDDLDDEDESDGLGDLLKGFMQSFMSGGLPNAAHAPSQMQPTGPFRVEGPVADSGTESVVAVLSSIPGMTEETAGELVVLQERLGVSWKDIQTIAQRRGLNAQSLVQFGKIAVKELDG